MSVFPSFTATTRHAASLFPWQLGTQLPAAGPVIGLDRLAGGELFRYDPWACYAHGILTSPNMLIAGQIGRGKSALVKTYLHRQHQHGRRCYVLDPKGEYRTLARICGLAHLTLSPGGPDRLNPLDPPPGAVSLEQVRRSRTRVVTTLVETGFGRPVTVEERTGIETTVADLDDRPVLADVVTGLLHPSTLTTTTLATDPSHATALLRPAALELRRLLTGDLAGMLDAPSTLTVDPDGPGLVLDLSAVFGTDALIPVMVAASAWLTATLTRPSPHRRILLLDEAWALLAATATTSWLQSVSKLARAHGISLVTVVHRLSDLAAQADTGTVAHQQALGLLADADTRVIYTQAPGERETTARLLGLSDTAAELLTRLPPYRGLWLAGRQVAVVDHLLADTDRDLVDTDTAMRP